MNKEDELYNSLAEDIVKENSLNVAVDWKPWEDSSFYEYVIMLRSYQECSIDEETFLEIIERLRRLLVVHITSCPIYIINFSSKTSSSAFKDFITYVPTFGDKLVEFQFAYFGMNIPEHYSPYQIMLLLHKIKETVNYNYESLPLLFFKRYKNGSYMKMFEFADYQTVMGAVENYKESCSLQLSLMSYSVEIAKQTVNKVEIYMKKIEDYEYEYNAKILAEAQARGDYDDRPLKCDRDKPLNEQRCLRMMTYLNNSSI